MSKLIVKPTERDHEGKILSVTPESAGWEYVGFEVYSLKKGETLSKETFDKEACLVLLSGKATVKTSEQIFEDIGKRMSVFEKIPPYSVYVAAGDNFFVTANTDLELAVCTAPGDGNHKTRFISPDDIGVEDRGHGKMSRKVHNILPEEENADSLLVVEVFTPDGNTSSYPPHKHDQNNLPYESYLEETYYHEVNPRQGFVFQRVYNDDRSLNETMSIENRNVVLVPEGYHPVSCVPGYESYYLNVMAGPVRTWKFHNEPAHEWLFQGVMKK
ncbi:5-deoxy-glucuronate isomerase [Bacillus sp. J14TS2]|uniref:5-deoxy-glucuronate isomerase n=1 Tax=Bacillus sp. J14TS2 TaxID=2807188 RepID=UPI001B1D27E9|nr:5-deoxy-glucuronate isomerase [Bacillus sp. J14TS2]GIN71564.1 5-deoxy-glucuronate isomerase [Bacillus sp. J14TS2]